MTYIMNFEKTYGKVSIEKDNVLLFYDIPIFFYEKKMKNIIFSIYTMKILLIINMKLNG